MSDFEVIALELRRLNFVVSRHAEVRMRTRSIKAEDIGKVGGNYTRARRQENGTYRFDGYDQDGDRCRWSVLWKVKF